MRLSELEDGHDRRSEKGRANAHHSKRKTICEVKPTEWEGRSGCVFGTRSR